VISLISGRTSASSARRVSRQKKSKHASAEVHQVNDREFPLEGRPGQAECRTENQRIQRAPDAVDGLPVARQISIAEIEVGNAILVHRLVLDGYGRMDQARQPRGDAENPEQRWPHSYVRTQGLGLDGGYGELVGELLRDG
jgi:hypothetical protein